MTLKNRPKSLISASVPEEPLRKYEGKELAAYMESIRKREIPESAPLLSYVYPESGLTTRFTDDFYAREEAIALGMYSMVDLKWTRQLAAWIGDRSVLEIMAGGEWTAKALQLHGVRIIATDDFSWKIKHSIVFEVKKMSALRAVRKISADILLGARTRLYVVSSEGSFCYTTFTESAAVHFINTMRQNAARGRPPPLYTIDVYVLEDHARRPPEVHILDLSVPDIGGIRVVISPGHIMAGQIRDARIINSPLRDHFELTLTIEKYNYV